jgi:hypothetical protein
VVQPTPLRRARSSSDRLRMPQRAFSRDTDRSGRAHPSC